MARTTTTHMRNQHVIIAGGSIAGLMCGLALKHAGHNVRIIEQAGDERQSHQAGIGLAPIVNEFLQRHDRQQGRFTHHTNDLRALKVDGMQQVLSLEQRDLTSWDSLYYRLRSDFDAYVSSYYPSAPSGAETDGLATYEPRKRVVDVMRVCGDHDLSIKILDLDTGDITLARAGYVIGADGPDSVVRAKYLPAVRRRYAGYVVWRGAVPESEVSDSAQALFSNSIMAHALRKQKSHCIVYAIPGTNGTVEPGKRLLNFILYTNETPETLDQITTDAIDGHRHRNTVPAGRVCEDTWARLVTLAEEEPLPAPFLEVIHRVRRPFAQVITDFCASRAAFEDGRVMLVGDALALIRPHAAVGTAQAAFHALALVDYISGGMSAREWEDRVVGFSFLRWQQSIWWGNWYQEGMPAATIAGLRYYAYVVLEWLRSWWGGRKPLA